MGRWSEPISQVHQYQDHLDGWIEVREMEKVAEKIMMWRQKSKMRFGEPQEPGVTGAQPLR